MARKDFEAWSARPGFWYRHPLLAWLLQLGFVGVLCFSPAPSQFGTYDQRLFGEVIVLLVMHLYLRRKKNDRLERRLRPSPFFFWC
jgi:hypothetical protein